jgi:uncharacterized protein YqeY
MLDLINKKIINAKKNKDKFTSDVFVLLKSELLNNQKSKNKIEEIEVVKKYAKKLYKTLKMFEDTDRYVDLKKEYDMISNLLPKQLSNEETEKYVEKYLKENPSNDVGKTIGAIKKQLKNVDGAKLASAVKKAIKND